MPSARDSRASTRFLLRSALAGLLVLNSCGGSKSTEPEPPAGTVDDRRFLPALYIPPTLVTGTTDETAEEARTEMMALLNFSRLLVTRTEPPLRRLQATEWTWEYQDCLWVRWNVGACPHFMQSCDTGERIVWTDELDGTCETVPPMEWDHALVLSGWSEPFGARGRLATCEAGRPDEILEIVAWETLPDGRTIRFDLTDRPPSGRDLRCTLDRLHRSDRRDDYDFTLPDSLRWTGEIARGGVDGRIRSYRWRGEPRDWVLWDEFSWQPARGTWKHHAGQAVPTIRTWGGGARLIPACPQDGPDSVVTSWGEPPEPAPGRVLQPASRPDDDKGRTPVRPSPLPGNGRGCYHYRSIPESLSPFDQPEGTAHGVGCPSQPRAFEARPLLPRPAHR